MIGRIVVFTLVLSSTLLYSGVKGGREQVRGVKVSSICEFIERPHLLSGKRVFVSARLESDGMHGDWLEDPSCHNALVSVSYPPKVRDRKDIKNLREVIFYGGGRAGTITKEIKGTFFGRFVWLPNAKQKYVLEIEKVEDLIVTPRKDD